MVAGAAGDSLAAETQGALPQPQYDQLFDQH